MSTEYSHLAMPITKKSIRTIKKFPEYYRGEPYVSTGHLYTDRQYKRFLRKGRRIKLWSFIDAVLEDVRADSQ